MQIRIKSAFVDVCQLLCALEVRMNDQSELEAPLEVLLSLSC